MKFRSMHCFALIALVFIQSIASAATQYISSNTIFYYNDTNTVLMKGGQTVTIDGAGRIISGRLADGSPHMLRYGPGRTVTILQNSLVQFAGGYIADGYLTDSNANLFYGTSRFNSFNANSHVKFANGFVSEGYLNATITTTVLLPYSSTGNVNANKLALIKFTPGADSAGYVSQCVPVSDSSIEHATGSAYFKAYQVTNFENGYIKSGVLRYSGSLPTASGSVYVSANTFCVFVNGYYQP